MMRCSVSCLLIGMSNAWLTSNLTFNGKERGFVFDAPSTTPSGLIVVLHPVSEKNLQWACETYSGQVSQTTGAVVVCPAAQTLPGIKSSDPGPCWKAWGHYGTCNSTDEDSEDVEYLAALIQHLQNQYAIPQGKIIMSGMSNGGSMAFRFNCEKSDLIGGLVIQSQAYLDPYVGYYDYVNGRVPTGTPQCKPTAKRPFYSDIGTTDPYYGPTVATQGFHGFTDWQTYSTQVLGCSGSMSETAEGPHNFPQGAATCYEYPSCPGITSPGINRFCSVSGMGHDAAGLPVLLPKAFTDFFGGSPGPSPPAPPSPAPPSPPAPIPAAGKDYMCDSNQCYEKPGYGTMDKQTCEQTCSSPAPSPSPSKGNYLCYESKCYEKPGSGTMDEPTCEQTCGTSVFV